MDIVDHKLELVQEVVVALGDEVGANWVFFGEVIGFLPLSDIVL